MEKVDPTRIENSINSLPGVVGCKVVTEENEIQEVHILDSSDKNPKQVIRDIESAVMVDCETKLDHKVISIAQINDNDVMPADNDRLKINGFSKNMNQQNTEVKVELRNNDKKYTGSIKGIITKGNKLRYFCEATLQAIEEYLGGTCSLTLNDVRLINIGRDKAVLVSVTMINGHNEENFLGSSLVRGENELSTIKATLNSINRRISILRN